MRKSQLAAEATLKGRAVIPSERQFARRPKPHPTLLSHLQSYRVDLFFLVSGFVLAYVYARPDDNSEFSFGSFCYRRFARIYPNYVASLLALLALVVGASALGHEIEGDYGSGAFVSQLFMVHALPIPGVFAHASTWNYPSWSVSIEVFAYVVVFPSLLKISIGHGRHLRYGLGLASALMFAGALTTHMTNLGIFQDVFRIVPEFSAGYLLFAIWHRSGEPAKVPAGTIPVYLALVLTVPFLGQPDWVSSILIATPMPIVLLSLVDPSHSMTRLLSSEPLLYLGRISYAIYLWHAVMEKVLKVALPADVFEFKPLMVRVAIGTTYLSCPIAMGAISFRFWEQPANKYLVERAGA